MTPNLQRWSSNELCLSVFRLMWSALLEFRLALWLDCTQLNVVEVMLLLLRLCQKQLLSLPLSLLRYLLWGKAATTYVILLVWYYHAERKPRQAKWRERCLASPQLLQSPHPKFQRVRETIEDVTENWALRQLQSSQYLTLNMRDPKQEPLNPQNFKRW